MNSIYEKTKNCVVKIVVKLSAADKEGSGTGFVYADPKNSDVYIISNEHVLGYCDGRTEFESFGIYTQAGNYQEFRPGEYDVISKSNEDIWDWIIIKIKKCNLDLKGVIIDKSLSYKVGDTVFFGGYPLDHTNYTFHFGNISSIFTSNSVKKIQIDGSINSGNSGGPLFDCEGRVIGIISRKDNGFIKNIGEFELLLKDEQSLLMELSKQLQRNGDVLKNSGGGVFISGIDTNAVLSYSITSLAQANHNLAVSFERMIQIWYNIKRSANVGIGYAFSIENLIQKNPEIFN
ncbi:MAG: hypothetical protein OHK0017_05680 [Patescibacteria group bacterium]